MWDNEGVEVTDLAMALFTLFSSQRSQRISCSLNTRVAYFIWRRVLQPVPPLQSSKASENQHSFSALILTWHRPVLTMRILTMGGHSTFCFWSFVTLLFMYFTSRTKFWPGNARMVWTKNILRVKLPSAPLLSMSRSKSQDKFHLNSKTTWLVDQNKITYKKDYSGIRD